MLLNQSLEGSCQKCAWVEEAPHPYFQYSCHMQYAVLLEAAFWSSVSWCKTWQWLFSCAKFGSESWRQRWLTCLFLQVQFSPLCVSLLRAGWWIITINHPCHMYCCQWTSAWIIFSVSLTFMEESCPPWLCCDPLHSLHKPLVQHYESHMGFFFHIRFQFWCTGNKPENLCPSLYNVIVQNRDSGDRKWVYSVIRQRLTYKWHRSLLYLYRARSKITYLSIPIHA